MPIKNPKTIKGRPETDTTKEFPPLSRKTMADINLQGLTMLHDIIVGNIKKERNPITRWVALREENSHNIIRHHLARKAPYLFFRGTPLSDAFQIKALKDVNRIARNLIGKNMSRFPRSFTGRTPNLVLGSNVRRLPWYTGVIIGNKLDTSQSPMVRRIDASNINPEYPKRTLAESVLIPQHYLDTTSDLLPAVLGHELGHVLTPESIEKVLDFSQDKISPLLGSAAKYVPYLPSSPVSRLKYTLGTGLGSIATGTGVEVLREYLANKNFSDFYANRRDIPENERDNFVRRFRNNPFLRAGAVTHMWSALETDLKRLSRPYFNEGPGDQAPVVTQTKQPGK